MTTEHEYTNLEEEGEDTEFVENLRDSGTLPPNTPLPKKVTAIRILAIVTLLMIPLAICVNIFWSYRLDPVGYFQCYSNYSYSFDIDCLHNSEFRDVNAKTACKSYGTAFWTHKITTAIWTCIIILHVCLITAWGKLNWGIHEILGGTILITSNIAATSGLIMVQADLVRYDAFTSVFVITAAVIVYLLTILWVLAFAFKPKLICRCCNDTRFEFNIHHSNAGFLFLLPPLGMLIQFIIYSAVVGIQGSKQGGCSDRPSDSDYLVWRISLIICGIIAFIMCLSFYFSYFKITKPYVVKPKAPEPRREICCGCLEVTESSLQLFGNLYEGTPLRLC